MIKFLRRLIGLYFRPYWKQCLLLFVCLLTLIAFDTLFPLGTKFLIDLAIIPQNFRLLVVLIIGLASLYLISSGGSLGLDYLTSWLSARVLNDMRLKMFAHLQDLPAGYYAKLQSGDIITHFNTDLAAIEYSIGFSIVAGIQAILQLIISMIVLLLLNVPLGLLTILILPLTAILPRRLVERASSLNSQRRVEESAINSTVQESLQANAVTRMFGLRDLAVAGFTRQLRRFADVSTSSSFTGWAVNRATNIGQYLIQLLIIAIGGYLVFIGKLSVGSWVGFTSLLISVGYAVALVSVAMAGLIPAVTSLERIDTLLDEKNPIVDHPDKAITRFSREIRFDNVTFSYAGAGGKPNLDRVSFSIARGQSVAFIGRSGSGKSTVLNLLMRSYDPQSGHILLDDQDTRETSLASLRAQMGVVFQDTFLFNLSLRENIRMGRREASDAEVESVARAAGVHETIKSLPDGYNTLAGEQGKLLSGGQRQRIALARAILRRPSILLLDEATSALDPETEQRIYDVLKELRQTCTILLVTHRLAPVADMDQIVVIDQGRVVEMGKHETLLGKQGLYHQLSTQQSGFKVSSDGLYAEVTPTRLRNIPLFSALKEADLEKFSPLFVTERCEAGYTIIQEGDLGEKFYIIVRGKTSVTSLGADNQPVHLPNMTDGEFFGEIALLKEGGRRTTTVQTLLPSLFLTLERKHFNNLVNAYPGIRAAIQKTAEQRIGEQLK